MLAAGTGNLHGRCQSMVIQSLAVRENERSVVCRDLDQITDALRDERAAMAGGKLLITGGAGFLGYYLVQAPLRWNASRTSSEAIRVTVLDNFARGLPRWLEELQDDPHLEVQQCDVRTLSPAALPDFDYVIHAASIASPTYYRKHPIETMDANVDGLRHLLEYARARAHAGRPLKGFLFYSTSEIYGDPDPAHIPTPETYRGNVSCTGPRACYDESKRYGETLCVSFARVHGLPVSIARPFNNYGPGLKITDRRVMADFARNVLEGEDIVLLSDGAPTRTWCYVADAVAGYYKVLVRGRPGEAYNIGTDGPEASVAELADLVAEVGRELFGYGGRVVRGTSTDPDYLTDNPSRRRPLIRKAQTELGYAPRISLRQGVERALLWYSDNWHAENA